MKDGFKAKRIFIRILMVIFLVSFCDFAFATEEIYGFKSLNATEELYQFMDLRGQLKGNIRDQQRMNINFAIGEFYFKANTLYDAKDAFRGLAIQNSAEITTLLANVFLYKIAKMTGQLEEQEALKKKIFKNQFVLLFDEYKILNYQSLYKNEYEIHYYADKIVVNLNGKLFEQIEP